LSSELLFEVTSKLDKRIRLSKDRWNRITSVKHTTVRGLEHYAKESLTNPFEIKKSKSDPFVYLYYGRLEDETRPLICTVAKHLNGDGFVSTIYFTRRMIGDSTWKPS
jgi:hypothetical protein